MLMNHAFTCWKMNMWWVVRILFFNKFAFSVVIFPHPFSLCILEKLFFKYRDNEFPEKWYALLEFSETNTCSESQKTEKGVIYNMFIANDKDIRTTPFWYLNCWLWTYITPFLLMTLNRQMFIGLGVFDIPESNQILLFFWF